MMTTTRNAFRPRIVVAYSAASSYVQTTHDYLSAIRTYLDADVEFIHVTGGAVVPEDLNCYDVILNNYCARLNFSDYTSPSYRNALKSFRGLKILAVQDEYEHTNTLKNFIKELSFDIVLTCVPPEGHDYVYPAKDFPNVKFVTVLTGYVPERLADVSHPLLPLSQRPIPIGYRGRVLDARYGALGFLKYEIGRRMRDICVERGIPHDIAVEDDRRIYGEAWFEFIGNCRAMLGSESGSNVFDFDGSIEKQYRDITAARGGQKPTYEEFAPYISAREREIQMGQISPRAFECAAMKTPMVLFRGQYSSILQADVHYIPLEIDFSNADQVLDRIQDITAMEQMAERTFVDIVTSGRYGYQAYMRMLSDLIYEGIARKGHVRSEGDPSRAAVSQKIEVQLTEMPTPDIKGIDYFMERALAKARHTASLTSEYYLQTCERGSGEVRLSERNGVHLSDHVREVQERSKSLRDRIAANALASANDDDDSQPWHPRSVARHEGNNLVRARILQERSHLIDAELEEWTRLHNLLLSAIVQLQDARRQIEGDSFRVFATARDISEAAEALGQISANEAQTIKAYRNTCQWADSQIARSRRAPGRHNELLADAIDARDRLYSIIETSEKDAEESGRAYTDQVEAIQVLSDPERADYLYAILARTSRAVQNIGRMNEEYNVVCAIIAKLETMTAESEAKGQTRIFSLLSKHVIRRILKMF